MAGLDALDPATIGGGLGILGTMLFIIRLAFSRLDKQDQTWLELLSAAERRAATAESRATSAEATLAELRKTVSKDRELTERLNKEAREELSKVREKLEEAQLQIAELQRWSGDTK